jgi:hypothetical protein
MWSLRKIIGRWGRNGWWGSGVDGVWGFQGKVYVSDGLGVLTVLFLDSSVDKAARNLQMWAHPPCFTSGVIHNQKYRERQRAWVDRKKCKMYLHVRKSGSTFQTAVVYYIWQSESFGIEVRGRQTMGSVTRDSLLLTAKDTCTSSLRTHTLVDENRSRNSRSLRTHIRVSYGYIH